MKVGLVAVLFLFVGASLAWAQTTQVVTVINMEDGQFNPSKVFVKQNDVVSFNNVGKEDHWPASDIHPTHTIYPEFDPKKGIKPSEKWQFKFEKAGVWRFHDHLNPAISGEITVAGEVKEIKKNPVNKFFESLKLSLQKIYYKLFPKLADVRLKKINFQNFDSNSPEVKSLLSILGMKKMEEKLIASSGDGRNFDCHQQAHKLGRLSYQIFGVKAFQKMDTTCHSGMIHGAMEAFLKEKGTTNLSANIKSLCDKADSAFGHFECLHGVGHGVLAYSDYKMPWALSTCKTLADNFSQSSCFGGVFMENIIVSEGNGVVAAHQTKWVSDDPFFPCNGVDQNIDVQTQCFMMQTSRMLDMYGYDFKKVAATCNLAPQNIRSICFQSMGRDASGQTLRNPLKTNDICKLAPTDYYRDCLKGALYVFVDFWGASLTSQPQELCKAVESKDKDYCYSLFGVRLPEIFGGDVQKIRKICGYSEIEYQLSCLHASGLNE